MRNPQASEMLKKSSAPANESTTVSAKVRLITTLLVQLQIAFDKAMPQARLEQYVCDLGDLADYQLEYAFQQARLTCTTGFIPTIGALRELANDAAMKRHRQQVEEQTQTLLEREAKPEDWPTGGRMADVWAEIEARADQQEADDLRIPDCGWEAAKRDGVHYVVWKRRQEAHARHRAGMPRPRMRAVHETHFGEIMAAATERKREERAQENLVRK